VETAAVVAQARGLYTRLAQAPHMQAVRDALADADVVVLDHLAQHILGMPERTGKATLDAVEGPFGARHLQTVLAGVGGLTQAVTAMRSFRAPVVQALALEWLGPARVAALTVGEVRMAVALEAERRVKGGQ
jgi:hypothetical protein